MVQQVPLGSDARADPGQNDDGVHEIAADLAYVRALLANVVFYGNPAHGERGWTLVDAGVFGTLALIKGTAEKRFGPLARPMAIVLTHGHFDHVGVLEDLVRDWDVPVFAHPLEHPYLNGTAAYPPGDPTVGGGLMTMLSPLYPTRPVDVSRHLRALPEDGSVPGMPGWRWVHTPGHSAGHVSFWREADRALIAGDAFITTAQESAYAATVQRPEMHGPPRYFTTDWASAERSVQLLSDLGPSVVITGHGRAMQGPRMAAALNTLARDFKDVAVPARGRYVDRAATVENGLAYRQP